MASDVRQVERVDWSTFLRRFRWKQGEHVALLGPTGRGKSTLAVEILKRRDFVVVLDLKGDDPALTAAGYEPIRSWPVLDLEREAIRDGTSLRVRLTVPVLAEAADTFARGRDVFRACIEDIRTRGRWTIYVDELRVTAERRLFDLAPEIEALIMFARGKQGTVVSATQAPRYIPRSAYDQVRHVFIWPVRDRDGLRRIEEIAGLGTQYRDALVGMAWHEVMYVRPPGEPVITMLDASRVPAPSPVAVPAGENPRMDIAPDGRDNRRRGWFW